MTQGSTVQELVGAYFRGRLRNQPAYPHLRPVLSSAMILVTGSYSFGMARSGSDLDVEVIVPDDVYPLMVEEAGGLRGLWVHDEDHDPLVDVKVRPLAWLSRRLNGHDPEALWIYQRAVLLQDPDGCFPPLMAHAQAQFTEHLPGLAAARYRELRSAVTIEHSRDELSSQILLGKAIESALVLPLLARQEPYPYPKWQAWWLSKTHPRGSEITALCRQLLASGEGMDLPLRGLRRRFLNRNFT